MKKNIKILLLSFIIVIPLVLGGFYIYSLIYGLPYPDNKDSLFPNYYLEKAIREQIGKKEGDIMPEDCLGVVELDLSSSDYNTDLEGIQYFEDLEILISAAGRLRDISALSELKNLREINFYLNEIEDVTPLSNLTNLEVINISNNPVTDISPLLNLKNLQRVIAYKTHISNLESLKENGVETHSN